MPGRPLEGSGRFPEAPRRFPGGFPKASQRLPGGLPKVARGFLEVPRGFLEAFQRLRIPDEILIYMLFR